MRAYEVMYILRPDLEEEATKELIERLSTVVTSHGGEELRVNEWGKRRLSYEIEKLNEGYYVLFNFNGEAETVSELERNMRISENVIRFMTIREEE
ncbi:MAG: 30S ribosomal protein S6 [Peptococcaceae bacterium]|nr:30S ribosomal protein S6 [Peptococcaceae bacterium]MDR2736006.1 30S ribosomal protein S6 [Gracilibacteraceae bacterium]